MQGTRTTAKILVGAAVAALTGCISVDTPPTVPAPSPAPAAESSVLPAHEVAPQIVEGPAREALEAALPDTPPPAAAPRVTPAPEPGPPAPVPEQPRRRAAPPAQQRAPRPEAAPRHREKEAHPAPRASVPEIEELAKLPKKAPVSRADICDLGERYGGWAPGSDQAKICHGTYGHR
ncbi:hypothetical protein [Streptomyces sp. NPDC056144]|uniref:hypothetical protein n=1 Tax=unclassified Streptomyces TaxID=2593676 RepID=UPI0035DC48AC